MEAKVEVTVAGRMGLLKGPSSGRYVPPTNADGHELLLPAMRALTLRPVCRSWSRRSWYLRWRLPTQARSCR